MSHTTSHRTPFEIARRALWYVGKFHTPPTPSVYKVWYRYVEGIVAVVANLDYAVHDAKAVSVEKLEEIHQQYCADPDSANDETSDNLAKQLASLQSAIATQLVAGTQFRADLDEACEPLKDDSPTNSTVVSCAHKMMASNDAMQQRVQTLRKQLQASEAEVRALQEEIAESRKTLTTDTLTGLGNRRHFDLDIHRALSLAGAEAFYSFLLLIDLDHFKRINDTFGHKCGDEVIRYVATHLTGLCPDAPISRLGGDEFAIILFTDNHVKAMQVASEIRQSFASTPLKLSDNSVELGNVELSIGGARLRSDDDAKTWFIRADKLLYQAKNAGRNSVVLEDQPAK
ncbi:GGDEF domain-containing protein [Rhodopirellula sp. SWK7]|uniref:GGDEF domain-containing protein n=1 Tax=Rhodopirellula sp. SWK7 TaxID=595460 RepID=UPI000694324E|nr:GGDEF domain-containing protein [Rhodopirellula sp. SWK7]